MRRQKNTGNVLAEFQRRTQANLLTTTIFKGMGKDRYYPPDGSSVEERSSTRKDSTRYGERTSEAWCRPGSPSFPSPSRSCHFSSLNFNYWGYTWDLEFGQFKLHFARKNVDIRGPDLQNHQAVEGMAITTTIDVDMKVIGIAQAREMRTRDIVQRGQDPNTPLADIES